MIVFNFFFFTLLGSNAVVKCVLFSLMNKSPIKHMNGTIIKIDLIININFNNMVCLQFYKMIQMNISLFQKVHIQQNTKQFKVQWT